MSNMGHDLRNEFNNKYGFSMPSSVELEIQAFEKGPGVWDESTRVLLGACKQRGPGDACMSSCILCRKISCPTCRSMQVHE